VTHLKTARPELVLVQGPPRSGRTSFLKALSAAAVADEHFDVVLAGDETFLRIALDSTVDDAARAVGAHGRSAEEVAAALEARAPVLVPIDGYRPSPSLARWLTDVLRQVQATPTPIVTVVADDAEALQPLSSHATALYELGDLDTEHVRSRLHAAGDGLWPPLTEDELTQYVDKARREPAALEALVALFQLVRSTDARDAAEATPRGT
jgi:DNA-binding NarL/FixJ family response regulator